MSNPVLFIIAGPNGSGKSLFSKKLTKSDLEVFDGDKHMTALQKKYPETGSEALWSFINENIFESQKREVLASRSTEGPVIPQEILHKKKARRIC